MSKKTIFDNPDKKKTKNPLNKKKIIIIGIVSSLILSIVGTYVFVSYKINEVKWRDEATKASETLTSTDIEKYVKKQEENVGEKEIIYEKPDDVSMSYINVKGGWKFIAFTKNQFNYYLKNMISTVKTIEVPERNKFIITVDSITDYNNFLQNKDNIKQGYMNSDYYSTNKKFNVLHLEIKYGTENKIIDIQLGDD